MIKNRRTALTLTLFLGVFTWLESNAQSSSQSKILFAAPTDSDETPLAKTWGQTKIQTEASRALLKKAEPLTIAIIDTGADVNHPLLEKALWKNPGETGTDLAGRDKSTNGIDDDQNGFVDDVSGWNFTAHDNDLTDHHGHGTHIAGLIGAMRSKPSSEEGIAPGVKLMILKYYDPQAKGSDNLKTLVQALRYAIRMHARIINYSGGGSSTNAEEKSLLQEAGAQGILVVAAAGNESSNSDFLPFYPADYGLPNVLSVGGHDPQGRIVKSSNFGLGTVDLWAPGETIFSTLPSAGKGEMTGTSQATAFVTGAAALLMSQRPDLQDPVQIIAHLKASVHFEAGLAGKSKVAGRLDLLRTLAIQDSGRSFSGYRIEKTAPNVKMRLPATKQD